MRTPRPSLAVLLVAIAAGTAHAHHSFAVYFDSNAVVEVTGAVTEFRFTNPHGTITVEVRNAAGEVEIWRAETNSPSILQRRGWSKDSLRIGEVITMTGWAARDSTRYLRMSRVTRLDGSVVGTPMTLDTTAGGDAR